MEEWHNKRRKALRKFDSYYNSFIDGQESDVMEQKKDIRKLIEEIRSCNRHLADDDNLYDEKLVEKFNSNTNRLVNFFKFNSKMNKSPSQSSSSSSENIDHLLNKYYIDNLMLTDTNWFDYYPKMMEFIVNEFRIDKELKLKYLRNTLINNNLALKIISNVDNIEEAIILLKNRFNNKSDIEREKTVQKKIETFHFNHNHNNDEDNFRKLFQLSLHIKHNVVNDDQLKQMFVASLVNKLPNNLRIYKLNQLIQMFRAKLRYYDCRFVLKPETLNELKQLYERLFIDGIECPICYDINGANHKHPITRCRRINEFRKKYSKKFSSPLHHSISNLSMMKKFSSFNSLNIDNDNFYVD